MDVLTHALVPALALAAAGVPLRRAGLGALFGVLPDLDAFLGPHRMAMHNLLALALATGAVAVASRGSARWLPAIAAFGFASHLALDLPTGVALAYPFTTASPYWSLQAFHDFGSGPFGLRFVLESGVLPAPPTAGDPIGLARADGASVVAVANFAVMTAALALAAQVAFARGLASIVGVRAFAARREEGPE